MPFEVEIYNNVIVHQNTQQIYDMTVENERSEVSAYNAGVALHA